MSRDKEEINWMPVLSVWDPADVAMIVARLQDQGIPALANPEAAFSALPVSVGMISEIRVMVPEAEQEHALEVLRDIGALTDQDEADEEN